MRGAFSDSEGVVACGCSVCGTEGTSCSVAGSSNVEVCGIEDGVSDRSSLFKAGMGGIIVERISPLSSVFSGGLGGCGGCGEKEGAFSDGCGDGRSIVWN